MLTITKTIVTRFILYLFCQDDSIIQAKL